MDRMSTSVSNRRLRRGWMSQTDTSSSNLSTRPLDTASETRDRDLEPKQSGWARIYFAPKLFIIQMYSFLRFGHSGGRPSLPSGARSRSILKWVAILYLGFSVLTFRPFDAYNSVIYWTKSSPTFSTLFSRNCKCRLFVTRGLTYRACQMTTRLQ
jgi:hypothetical protein